MSTLDDQLVYAIISSDVPKVRAALDAGANPNAGSGRTALFFAATQRGTLELVNLLLERGADVTRRDSSGMDVLHAYLVDCGPPRMIPGKATSWLPLARRLIDAGLDLRARNADLPHSVLACRSGNAPLLDLVLEHGSDPNARDKEGGVLWRSITFTDRIRGLLTTLVKHGIDANHRVKNAVVDTSILMEVCTVGDLETAHTLLDRGADPNFRGRGGTPLSRARSSGNRVLIDLLLERGATAPGSQIVDPHLLRSLDLAEEAVRANPGDRSARDAWRRALEVSGFRAAAASEAQFLGTAAPAIRETWQFLPFDPPPSDPAPRTVDARFPRALLSDGVRTLPLVVLAGAPCSACDERGEQVCNLCDGKGFSTGQFDDTEYPCAPRQACSKCLRLRFVVIDGSHLGRGDCAHPTISQEFSTDDVTLHRCAHCGLAALRFFPTVSSMQRTFFACGECAHFVCVC